MSSVHPLASAPPLRARLADYVSLTKPRITSLVLVTTGIGFLLARSAPDWGRLLTTIIGTALVAGGASAFNQVWERERDARMRRTAGRALPAGRLEPMPAAIFAAGCSLLGILLLAFGASLLAAGLATVTLLLYVLVYTPLKVVSSLCTVVGAVPGALPPVIGWAAAAGALAPGAWALFAIVFLWQMPHFLAIAWLYREDFARGGYPMLPVLEPDGASTGRQAALYALTLLPVSLSLAAMRLAGSAYIAGAVLCGGLYAGLAIGFASRRTAGRARLVFLASILYLPAVLALAFLDRVR
jgi:protoheme IX farnesyltransferase